MIGYINYLNSLNSEQLDEFLDKHLEKVNSRPIETANVEDAELTTIFDKVSLDRKQSHSNKRKYYSIAASVAFIFVISIAAIYFIGRVSSDQTEVIWIERITNPGQKLNLTLRDGSKVTVNSVSKISYPEDFGNEARNIKLEGEAYFEVTNDPTRPFSVRSSNITTTVLGTIFNINAYSLNNNIVISLLEGKVKVSNQNVSE